MRISRTLWTVFCILAAPALISTLLLYNYPLVFKCAFPKPSQSVASKLTNGSLPDTESKVQPAIAPFRLLALGDPQLEGDTSLPDPNAPLLPSLHKLWRNDYNDFSRGFQTQKPTVLSILRELLNNDIPRAFQTYRKQLDLLGNDYYLAHIYRTLDAYLAPTHTTVLGDLIGSQWISDEEFDRRQWRFWNRVFRNGQRVQDDLTKGVHIDTSKDGDSWRNRIINVAGNHDIGYTSDITRDRVKRFEKAYGKVNWDVTFDVPQSGRNPTGCVPSIRLVVLNDMNMDGPSYDPGLQAETYAFIAEQVTHREMAPTNDCSATILLTHVPLYKEEGICVDGPLFEYGRTGLREQNHLSYGSSIKLLQDIFGMQRSISDRPDAPHEPYDPQGLILTGHDHEGCNLIHHWDKAPSDPTAQLKASKGWPGGRESRPWHLDGYGKPSVSEITVRSMMGSYGGNAGLLSGWYDVEIGRWRFAYGTCALGVQHWWWAVHVLDVVVLGMLGAAVLASMVEWMASGPSRDTSSEKPQARVFKQEGRATLDETMAEGLSDDKMYGDASLRSTGHSYEAAASLPRKRRRKG